VSRSHCTKNCCHLWRVFVPSVVCFVHPKPVVCFVHPKSVVCFVHPPFVVCLRATPSACLRTALSCAFTPQNHPQFKPLNQFVFILYPRHPFPILQQRCPSKATSRRQRIMADHVVVKFRRQRIMTRPLVQVPRAELFLVASFGCCER